MFDAVRREATYIAAIARTLWMMRFVKPDATRILADILAEIARDRPNAVAILFEERTTTYRELDEGANRYAIWAHGQGISKGETVVLLMENCPEYLMAWLGLHRVGAIAALINTNLRGQPLAHSIGVASARHAIIGASLADNFSEATPLLERVPVGWSSGGARGLNDLDPELARQDAAYDPSWRGDLSLKDKAFYIYTSGTTGLPKAANISHMRMLFMMVGFAGALGATEHDRLYDPLPLYHSAGGIAGLGPSLLVGGSLIIRRKFSVHEFWEDCFRYRATLFQYIGELCRYLLNAPAQPHERDHSLRAAIGNGLRPEIWNAFRDRFRIPKIVEFYGSTEGNVSFLGYDGKAGAVGRLPRYMRRLIGTRIVRFDFEREEPIRGSDGFCIECAPDETGEALGRLDAAAGRSFEGYTKASETQKKILRDVFEKGDSWFRTGDLLRRDRHHYIYFVDRIGDTFRWKGENVSTGEVSEALGVVGGVKEANVYGVSVPGMDGKAGMAALVTDDAFDASTLARDLATALPAYAVPQFLRLQPDIEVTGTFKHRKIELVRNGFDPEAANVPLYWLNPSNKRYEPLTPAIRRAIVSGEIRL